MKNQHISHRQRGDFCSGRSRSREIIMNFKRFGLFPAALCLLAAELKKTSSLSFITKINFSVALNAVMFEIVRFFKRKMVLSNAVLWFNVGL